jgi:hypothetical protein
MKKKIFLLHPKSHRRFWHASANATGSVCERYGSENPDPHPDPSGTCAVVFSFMRKECETYQRPHAAGLGLTAGTAGDLASHLYKRHLFTV